MSDTKKKLSHDLTRHIAHLAHLELKPEEVDQFTDQMNSILANFEQLAEVDVEGIEPTHHAMAIKNVYRDDVPKPGLTQAEALENAPKTDGGYIKAPRIV